MFFALVLAALCLALPPHVAQVAGECGPCSEESCPPVSCRVPDLLARDECGCCPQCLSVEGEACGGRGPGRPRCTAGLVCVSRDSSSASEAQRGTGLCVCKEDSAVCGSDGRSYQSVCALHLQSWEAQHAGRDRLHKVHDGECKMAPVITVAPKRIHNSTGAQVYLSCEVKAVPTPIVTWRKVTESPKGTKLLEDLPGDRVNMAVQVRGGPSRHESTGWVLINPLTKEDEGVYQCHAANMVGEAHAEGMIQVTEHTTSKKANHRTSDDKK